MRSFEKYIVRPVVLLVGIALVEFAFMSDELSGLGRLLSFLGGLAVFYEVIHVMLNDRFDSLRKTVTVATEDGQSTIAIDALEGILRDEVCKAGDVHDVDVRLAVGNEGEPIRCVLRFRLDSQPDIPGRTDIHKRAVRETFAKLIPGNVELEITCNVVDIVVPRPAEPAPAGPDEDRPFAGPVYPVPGEGESSEGFQS